MIRTACDCCQKNFLAPQMYINFYNPYFSIFEKKTEENLQELIKEDNLPPMKVTFTNF